jgi:hypothetical protein
MKQHLALGYFVSVFFGFFFSFVRRLIGLAFS